MDNYNNDPVKRSKTKKMMLWFCLGSLAMVFAGLTSAYVVSNSRKDWSEDFEFPQAFYLTTIFILLISILLYLTKKAIQKNDNQKLATYYLLASLLLSIGFVWGQFYGFQQFIAQGYYFTGAQSSISVSFIYIIVLAHLVHVFSGVLVLLTLIYNHFKQRYKPNNLLGLELGIQFWHFLDLLWIYLLIFFMAAT